MNTKQLFNLKGKIALVTGADRGIGKAMAIGLAEAGASIISVSRSTPAKESEVEKAALSANASLTAYRLKRQKEFI